MGCASSRPLNVYRVPNSRNIRGINSKITIKKSKVEKWKNIVEALRKNSSLNDYVLNKNRQFFRQIPNLIQHLTQANTKNDIEKVWIVFLWITHNIDYNFEGYTNRNYGNQDADSVLRTGTSVCGGFSNLFNDLCKGLNIETKLIEGYGKGLSYTVGSKFTAINHEWNAVKIDNEWHLVECTWGAGGYNDVTKKYDKHFQPFWFFTPSEIFIYEHFPSKSQEDQLLSKPLTQEEFEILPDFKIDYFLNGFKCVSNVDCKIVPQSNPFRLEFKNCKDKQIFGEVSNSKFGNSVFVQKNAKRNKIEIDVALESKKDTKLVLFGGAIEPCNCICEFLITPSPNLELSIFEGFCDRNLFPKDIYLFEPKEKVLKLNTEYQFKVMVDVKDVALISSDGTFKHFVKEENQINIWVINYTPTINGKLKLSARIEDNVQEYIAAFSYKVE